MKRKTIVFSVLLIVCVGFYFVREHYARIENRILRDIETDTYLLSYADVLCREYKIPIVVEGYDHSAAYAHTKRTSYLVKKATVRQLLDKIVPPKDFIWETHGDAIHIISRKLASRSDYQMNSVIGHFSAKNVDRNTLIKLAIARTTKPTNLEPLIYGEVPFKKYNKADPPKISINVKHATLREVLDEISLKANFCYNIEWAQNPDSSFASQVPIGSYALWLTIPADLPTFEELESASRN